MTDDAFATAIQNLVVPHSLLAAAAGAREAVDFNTACLVRTEIARGPTGRAEAPSRIVDRIEALSVRALPRLQALANSWPSPKEVAADPWWMITWQSALRHLLGTAHWSPDFFEVPALDRELGLLLGYHSEPSLDWPSAIQELQRRGGLSHAARGLAPRVRVEAVVSQKDIAGASPAALRLLRGHGAALSEEARTWLVEQISLPPGDDSYRHALAAELCRELAPNTLGAMRAALIRQLEATGDSDALAPAAYVCLHPTWRTP